MLNLLWPELFRWLWCIEVVVVVVFEVEKDEVVEG